MAKKNLIILKDPNCLNCGYPFTQNEKFCPECGQKNKGKKITLSSFIREVFAGFFSWDAKFWRTLIPLLISPGKISNDYINGKRERYANPFRFYLTISILFFLLVGITDSYYKLNDFRTGNTNTSIFRNIDKKALDSLQIKGDENLKNVLKSIDSISNKEIEKVTTSNKEKVSKTDFNFSFKGSKLDKFIAFQEKHPYINIDDALDSLQIEKTFFNRFLYNRTEKTINIVKSSKGLNELKKQIYSYISISLFIFLPLFTLFLKFFYIRKNFTYVEHLVFVFHTQTVFFMLLIIFYAINIIKPEENFTWLFLLLFLVYLFLAMKKFYNQGYFKTSIKFMLLNTIYTFIGSIGVFIVALIAFLLY